jgi:hypothetical protein
MRRLKLLSILGVFVVSMFAAPSEAIIPRMLIPSFEMGVLAVYVAALTHGSLSLGMDWAENEAFHKLYNQSELVIVAYDGFEERFYGLLPQKCFSARVRSEYRVLFNNATETITAISAMCGSTESKALAVAEWQYPLGSKRDIWVHKYDPKILASSVPQPLGLAKILRVVVPLSFITIWARVMIAQRNAAFVAGFAGGFATGVQVPR